MLRSARAVRDGLPLRFEGALGPFPPDSRTLRAHAFTQTDCLAYVRDIFPVATFLDRRVVSVAQDLLAYRFMQVVVMPVPPDPFSPFRRGAPALAVFRTIMMDAFPTDETTTWVASLRTRLFATSWDLLNSAVRLVQRRLPATIPSASGLRALSITPHRDLRLAVMGSSALDVPTSHRLRFSGV